jgi:hypothetical protein
MRFDLAAIQGRPSFNNILEAAMLRFLSREYLKTFKSLRAAKRLVQRLAENMLASILSPLIAGYGWIYFHWRRHGHKCKSRST